MLGEDLDGDGAIEAGVPSFVHLSHAPGTTLGPYEIQSPLGAGGMGEVHAER